MINKHPADIIKKYCNRSFKCKRYGCKYKLTEELKKHHIKNGEVINFDEVKLFDGCFLK